MEKYLFPVTQAACRGKLPQTSGVCFAPCANNIPAISNLVVVEVIDDDQKCFSPSKVIVRRCFAPWDNNIANISNNISLIMWMIIGSIDCAGDQIITFIVPNRHYLMSWFNTTSVQPVLLLCCYTVMLLFCYAVMPLFCYAAILLCCCAAILLCCYPTCYAEHTDGEGSIPGIQFSCRLFSNMITLHCYIVTL